MLLFVKTPSVISRIGWQYSGDAQTGQQTQNNGNVWSGTSFVEGVRHEGGNAYVIASQLLVPSLTNPQDKPTVVNIPNSSVLLFGLYSGALTKYSCLTQAACAYNVVPCNPCNPLNSSDIAVANNTLQPSSFVEAQTWRDKRVLYEKIEDNPDLAMAYPVLAEFQDSVETTEIKDFVEQKATQRQLFRYNSTTEAQLTSSKLQIANYETQLTTIDAALSLDTLGLQTETLKSQRQAISTQLSVVTTQYEVLAQQVANATNQKIEDAKDSNLDLTENNV